MHRYAISICNIVIAAFLLGGHCALASAQTYPLHVSKNGRYLVSRNGKPFFIVGDSPQALMVNISEDDAEAYFANRAKYGFNSVWINLLCADYTGGRPDASTRDGMLPWTARGDLSTPNETYFAHCDRVLKLAAKHGLLVFLAYLPTSRPFRIDMSKMSGPVLARWFDPTNGKYTTAQSDRLPNSGFHDFTPPQNNAGGHDSTDWVFVLENR